MTDGVAFTITMPPDEADEVRQGATDMGITVDEYLALAVAGYLPHGGWGEPDSDPEGVAMLEIADAVASLVRARRALEIGRMGLDLSDFCTTIDHMISKLRTEDDQLGKSAMAIMEDAPLAISFGVRPWAPPLSPHGLLRAAGLAQRGAPVTVTYRQALRNAQAQRDAEARDTTSCPRAGCGGTKVNRPGGTRASACYGHLSADEKTMVRRERTDALDRPCRSCNAAAGEPCATMGRGSSVHPVRLNPHLDS